MVQILSIRHGAPRFLHEEYGLELLCTVSELVKGGDAELKSKGRGSYDRPVGQLNRIPETESGPQAVKSAHVLPA